MQDEEGSVTIRCEERLPIIIIPSHAAKVPRCQEKKGRQRLGRSLNLSSVRLELSSVYWLQDRGRVLSTQDRLSRECEAYVVLRKHG